MNESSTSWRHNDARLSPVQAGVADGWTARKPARSAGRCETHGSGERAYRRRSAEIFQAGGSIGGAGMAVGVTGVVGALAQAGIQRAASGARPMDWLVLAAAIAATAGINMYIGRALRRRVRHGARSCAGCAHWRHEAMDMGTCRERARYARAYGRACRRWRGDEA